jgi:STE24 endopeptidase
MTTFIGLKVADWGLQWGMAQFGYEHVWDIAAFPLLALCLFVFGLLVMPLNNAFSRSREWKADATALELTANRDAFIRAMRKLADQNLADLSPHPVVEFLLHDHPSLARRIAWAERWQAN